MTLMRKNRNIIILTVFVAILAMMMGCTKPDRSGEAEKLIDELTDLGFENLELALARVDSADEAGVFTVVQNPHSIDKIVSGVR